MTILVKQINQTFVGLVRYAEKGMYIEQFVNDNNNQEA